MTVEFGILGPLEVRYEGRLLELGGSRRQALLAALIVQRGEPVDGDRLVQAVWGEEAPPTAGKALYVNISRLRTAFGAAASRLVTTSAGYRLDVGPDECDAWRFERLSALAEEQRVSGRADAALATLSEALSLWRGPALADVRYEPFVQAEIARLEELRWSAIEERLGLEVELGRYGAALSELEQLAVDAPARERLVELRMRALYHAGRHVDALAAYREAASRLRDELGLEPGPGLRELERAILAHDPALATHTTRRASLPTDLPLPRPLRMNGSLRFVGRDRELAHLRELWVQARTRALAGIVVGEAGIGKTRIAAEFARAVHNEGALVLYGRCDEGLGVPYQPFVEALNPVTHAMGSDRVRAELGALAPNLVRMWPELDVGEPTQSDPESDRYRLFEAVTALLEAATRENPALVVLDDLHWAARPTLLLLRHLMRSERRIGAFVLSTCRDTELAPDHPLPRLLADLQREAHATTLRIAGLDERGTAVLLESAVGEALDDRAAEFARVLRAETGGNPFFIRELLAHLVESGAIHRAGQPCKTEHGAAGLEVPEGLRHVIRQRVARLSEPARRALDVAAVAGPTFALSVLEGVVGEPSALLDGLDEAVAAGLLAEAGPGEYAFAHALVHQTIYEGHSAARRMRLHRRLGEALQARPDADAHIEALAHHFALSAADGQATKAAAYALAAGRKAAARLAYENAAAHYEQGLQALELAAEPQDERRGELLLALVGARWGSGDMEEARRAGRRAAELADRRGDPAQLARAALGYAGPARFEMPAAVSEPRVDLLNRALDALGDTDSRLRARVMARLASAVAFGAPDRRRPELAYEALAMARRLGNSRTLMEVLATGHMARWRPDNLAERRAAANELAGLAAEAGNAVLEAVARRWTITNLLELGEIDEAERESALYDRIAHTLHQRYPRSLAVGSRAQHALLEGRLEDYEALAHEALALGLGDESATQVYLGQMIFLRREQGRLDELVDDVRDVVERYPTVPAWRCTLAFVYAELDRRHDARREVEALACNDFADLPRDFLWLFTLAFLSDAVASLDDPRCAERLYPLLLPFADRCAVADGPFCLGSVSRPLGLLATTLGLFEAAAHHFEDALKMNVRIRSPLWLAHTQHDYARMLQRRDEPADRKHAAELLDEALATADKLDLTALTDGLHRACAAA